MSDFDSLKSVITSAYLALEHIYKHIRALKTCLSFF